MYCGALTRCALFLVILSWSAMTSSSRGHATLKDDLERAGLNEIRSFYRSGSVRYFVYQLIAETSWDSLEAHLEYCQYDDENRRANCVTERVVKRLFIPLDRRLNRLQQNFRQRQHHWHTQMKSAGIAPMAITGGSTIGVSALAYSTYIYFTMPAASVLSPFLASILPASLIGGSASFGAAFFAGPIGWVAGATLLVAAGASYYVWSSDAEEKLDQYRRRLIMEIIHQKPKIILSWKRHIAKHYRS